MLAEDGTGIEANLVLATTQLSIMTSGKSYIHVGMGYFWVFDRFDYNIPRKRRLLVHSRLSPSLEEKIETGTSHSLTSKDFGVLYNKSSTKLADKRMRFAA